jgi:hypothetical protein
MRRLTLALNIIVCTHNLNSWNIVLDYVQSSCTIDMIIATGDPRADQHIVTKDFLFTETTHPVLSSIYYT